MGESSAVILRQLDAFTTAPNAGALYVQRQTLGVLIEQPGGANLILGANDFTGGGPVKVDQAGVNASYGGYPTAMPTRACQMIGGIISITSGTVLPAPDFTPWNATGATSRLRLSATTNIDWIGGIAVPFIPGGGSPEGVHLEVQNVSGGGAQINIIDLTAGGAVRVGATSVALGFLETATFVYDALGWQLLTIEGAYYFNGGNSGSGGSRVVTAFSTVTPVPLIQLPNGAATTPGAGFIAQIAAEATATPGVSVAWWYNVRMSWDGTNNPIGVLTIDDIRGTGPGGAPPFGWTLTVSSGGGFNTLNFIGDAAHVVSARAKWVPICPPF